MERIKHEQIDKILNEFLLENGFECTATLGTDFSYWYSKSEIQYALLVSERMDRLFNQFAKTLGLKFDCGNFLLSFFHELGHDQTMDFLEDEEEEYSRNTKKNLTTSNEDTMVYFNLPDEIEATTWAVNYINNNFNKIQNLVSKLEPEINNFYKEYLC